MKLSIIIPIYNVEQYIEHCIKSILSQRADSDIVEIILVNDGTPDRSMEFANKLISKEKNVQIINQDNQGLSAARNAGLDAANGEYVWFVDSDDWLLPNALSDVFSILKKEQKVDVISSRLLQIFEVSGNKKPDFTPTLFELDGKEYLKRHYCQGAVQRFILHRQFLIEHHLAFYPKLLHEDNFFGLQMLYYAQKIVILPEPIYAYRIRQSGSIMSSITMKSPNDLLFIHKQLRKFQKDVVAKEDQYWYQHRIAYVLNDLYQFSKYIICSKEFQSFYRKNWVYLHKEALALFYKPSTFFEALRMTCFPVLWIKFKRYTRNHILFPISSKKNSTIL